MRMRSLWITNKTAEKILTSNAPYMYETRERKRDKQRQTDRK